MNKRIDGPMTAVSFDYLPDTDEILCVYDHGGIYADKNSPNTYTILTHFFVVPDNDPNLQFTSEPETRDIEIPLSDFLFFGCGSWFKRRMHRGRSKHHKITSFSNLQTFRLVDAFVDGAFLKIYSERDFGMDRTIFSQRGGSYLISKKGKKLVFKDSIEIFRFFVCGLSKYADVLINQLAEETLDEPAYYEDETYKLDDDTFVISPSPRFADPAIAIQLALIIQSKDLKVMFNGIGQVISRTRILKSGSTPELIFPELSKSISATYRDAYPYFADSFFDARQMSSPKNRCMMLGQILSDNREIPFKKLIIKSPNKGYEYELDSSDTGNESETGTTVEKLVKGELTSNKFNPNRKKRRVRTLNELSQAFPRIRGVKIKVDKETRRIRKVQKQGEERERTKFHPDGEIDSDSKHSTGDGGFSGNANPLIHIPKLKKRHLFGGKIFSPGERRLLFYPELRKSNLIEVDINDVATKDERCSTLIEAVQIFKENYSSANIHIESIKGYRATGKLTIGAKDARWMIVVNLNIDSLSSVWIEPVRVKDEAICLGIVNRIDGNDVGVNGLRNILDHCGNRIQLRGKTRIEQEAFSGIWPTHFEFDDATGSRLWHSPRRKNPDFLAEDLYDESMLFLGDKITT